MAQYRITTDGGTYLVTTDDGPPPSAPPSTAQPGLFSRAGHFVADTLSKTADHLDVTPMLQRISEADSLAGQGRWADAWDTVRELLPGASPSQQVLGNQNGDTFQEQKDFVQDTARKVKTGDYSGATANALTAAMMNAEHLPAAADATATAARSVAAKGAEAASAAADAAKPVLAKAAESILKPGFKVQLDPAEAAAVAYGRDNGVQMPTSVITGSKVAKNAENIAQNLPLMSGVAKDARAAEQSTLAAAGAGEVSQLGARPDAPVPAPLDAGEAVNQALVDKVKRHTVDADDSYGLFRSIESQPEFKANLQTGTQRVAAGIDEEGNPVFKNAPVMEDVQLPVDYRGMKAAVKPLLAETQRGMSITQRQSSTGIATMQAILDAPDFVPASTADQDLGAMKEILRESPQTRSVWQVKQATDLLSQQVDAAAKRAGPDAVAALKAGREATVAKYDTQKVMSDLGWKNVGTGSAEAPSGVALVNKITADGDLNVRLLQRVAEHAPDQIPGIAQSIVQGLIEKGSREAGMAAPKGALADFNKLGPQTQQTLFGDRASALKNWFTLNKLIAENPNPSGSGSLLAMVKGLGLVLSAPLTGGAYIIGAKPLARMLFDPAAGRNLIQGMRVSADSPGAGLLAKNIIKAAGSDAVPATPSGVSTTSANASTIAGDGPRGSGAPNAPGVGGAPGAPPVLEAQGRGGDRLRSADTVVPVPGESGAGYPARYVVKELGQVNASHNGNTFQPNPKYGLSNDRNYANAVNQGKIIAGASRSEFNPALHITDNPDATNGPLITDTAGNVLGGNGRKMMLDRVYAGNPQGAADYRALLKAKAEQYGIDPASLDGMKQPVLTREIPDSALPDAAAKQKAVTDFNKKGTAELTPAERAIADSRRVSPETLSDIAGRLDAKGPEATVAQVLEGKAGGEVLNKLVSDGVVTPQERGAFMEGSGPREGELTAAGKARISQLMLARFFRDPAQIESMAPEIRNRVERIAAPLAQVENKPDWNLTPHLKDALEIVENARQRKTTIDDSLKQDGLFGSIQHDPKAVTLAKALKSMKSQDLTAGARQYAGDANFASKGDSMFGEAATPESSFAAAFEPKPAEPPAANALNALAPKKPRKKK